MSFARSITCDCYLGQVCGGGGIGPCGMELIPGQKPGVGMSGSPAVGMAPNKSRMFLAWLFTSGNGGADGRVSPLRAISRALGPMLGYHCP